jgi:hypothetical protein
MTEHYCEWDLGHTGGTPCASMDCEAEEPCGKVARFEVDGAWLCADHYDEWCRTTDKLAGV